MRRLVKKAFGLTLYHGTNFDSFKQIMETGMIIPQENKSTLNGYKIPDRLMEKYDGFSYFTDSKEVAIDYAMGNSSDYNVVIEVDLSEDALLPDDIDTFDAKDWKESLQQSNQVKVPGIITSDYFKNIYFYDNNKQLLLSTNINNWENDLQLYENSISG